MVEAGYTHIIVAFGVFSLVSPGVIVPVFELVDPAYISAARAAGLIVTLSVGGASSSAPDTTVDFHQAVGSSSMETFAQTFVDSYTSLASTYGFQGIDFDLEHGFNLPSVGSTFYQPTGDIAIVAEIIRRLRSHDSGMVISLAPQTANVAPSSVFDYTWANYSSLIMLIGPLLNWVGIQLYNSGSMFGIDQELYSPSCNGGSIMTSPDFAVAMAVNLLENWPASVNGRSTGWYKYVSTLRPDQVVLGYVSPDARGTADGSPYPTIQAIRRAISCLQTGQFGISGCDTYTPPRIYPQIGGVFNWEISYDAQNAFAFASGLKACMQGTCA